jgi:signal peptidase II
LQGQGVLVPLLAIAVVAFLLRMYHRVGSSSAWFAVGSGLIFGGSLGNLIDRVRLGFVIDFIRIASWPTFNLADSAITIGALVLAWWYWGYSPREHQGGTETVRSLLHREGGAQAEPDR